MACATFLSLRNQACFATVTAAKVGGAAVVVGFGMLKMIACLEVILQSLKPVFKDLKSPGFCLDKLSIYAQGNRSVLQRFKVVKVVASQGSITDWRR